MQKTSTLNIELNNCYILCSSVFKLFYLFMIHMSMNGQPFQRHHIHIIDLMDYLIP